MGSGNAELCSDVTCGVKSSTGGGIDDNARSPGRASSIMDDGTWCGCMCGR